MTREIRKLMPLAACFALSFGALAQFPTGASTDRKSNFLATNSGPLLTFAASSLYAHD